MCKELYKEKNSSYLELLPTKGSFLFLDCIPERDIIVTNCVYKRMKIKIDNVKGFQAYSLDKEACKEILLPYKTLLKDSDPKLEVMSKQKKILSDLEKLSDRKNIETHVKYVQTTKGFKNY